MGAIVNGKAALKDERPDVVRQAVQSNRNRQSPIGL
jgi:hypothetical protein